MIARPLVPSPQRGKRPSASRRLADGRAIRLARRRSSFSLPGDAWCVVPAAHPAHRSAAAARALGRALADALAGGTRGRRRFLTPMSTLHVPYIIERSSRGERTYDIFSRLLMDRIIFLGTQINDDVANIIIAQLLFLEADAPGKDIQLYINSPGGDVSAGLAIYDTMQHLSSPVATICVGMAASMGAFSSRRAARASGARCRTRAS